jgi:hypothetical protein
MLLATPHHAFLQFGQDLEAPFFDESAGVLEVRWWEVKAAVKRVELGSVRCK